jgi:gamma-glutamylcyclotransferase (GGCT)/AIG2-like uncharacterized protein YtfP
MPLLFSYGTLQRKPVQLATFGREVAGREDALPGYNLGLVPIRGPAVVAETGDTHYANVEPANDPAAAVPGTVLDVTPEELAAADRFEEPARYARILVTLRSGAQAWVYVYQPD